MSSIYYPYFMIEKLTDKRFNHKKYLNILSLFSKNILIPCRHFFSIGNDEFDALVNNGIIKNFIQDGTVYYRLPKGIDSLYNYIEDLSSHSTKYRISVLDKASPKSILQYDPKLQQDYFSNRIKSFLNKQLKNKKLNKVKADIQKLTNQTTITKELFDDYIKKIAKAK